MNENIFPMSACCTKSCYMLQITSFCKRSFPHVLRVYSQPTIHSCFQTLLHKHTVTKLVEG